MPAVFRGSAKTKQRVKGGMQVQLHSLLLISVFVVFTNFQQVQASAMMRSKAAFAVRVVSYNVLSSHLASPSHFSTLDPCHLKSSNRLPLIFKKLEDEITSSDNNCIFCLQEVSHDWAGQLHTFFANRGFHFITGLYGKKFNGYMGVGVAYPTSLYETVDVDISRLADKRKGGWPKEPEPSTAGKLWNAGVSLVKYPLQTVGVLSTPDENHWTISENRFNILVTATLKHKPSGKSFLVSNYHMPCCYYAPMVMTIHSEMAARRVQHLSAQKDNIPYILAGDWNITPDSATYKLMTTGILEETDATFPTPLYGMEWKSTIQGMRSAYFEKLGSEPDFTNYARIKEQEPFIDTLDYIFLSSEWKVAGVKEIPHRNDANGPFPNAEEPSDHVMIYADLELS